MNGGEVQMRNDEILSYSEKPLPFVWCMNYEGVEHTLVGTKHSTPPQYGQDVQERLCGIEQLLLELELSNGPHAAVLEFNQYLVNELAQRFNPKEMSFINSLIKERSGTGHGVDLALEHAAHARNICVYGLETAEEKIVCLRSLVDYGLSYVDKIPAVVRSLFFNEKTREKLSEHLAQQQEFYDKGDSVELAASLKKMFAFVPSDMYDNLLVERNKTMVERSLPYLTKPTLVAVGVGHFLCEPTMLELYEQQGARITRMEKKRR